MTNQTLSQPHSREGATPESVKPKYNWTAILQRPDVTKVAIDTESVGLDHWEKDYHTSGFSIAARVNGTVFGEYIPFGHEVGANADWELAKQILTLAATKLVIFHNVNFDRRNFMIDMGIWFPNTVDTAKLSHLVDENWGTTRDGNTKTPRSLDNLAHEYVGMGKTKTPVFDALVKVVGWRKIPYEHMAEYASQDAVVTYLLYEALIALAQKNKEVEDVLNYYLTYDQPNFDTLYNMKSRGILVDVDACRLWEIKAEQEMARLKDELGFDPNKKAELEKALITDLGLPVLYNMKKIKNKETGEYELMQRPTMDKKAMEQYEEMLEEMGDKSGIAKRILAFRGWEKACSSYYRPYQELVKSDGRMRPDYKSHGTVTGRYACSEPNLQQIPKESNKPWNGEIKKLFLAKPGHTLWEYDYSQLEFRLNAHFAREPFLLEVFNDHDRDIFTEMAGQLGWTRQECKGFTYSTLYGAGKGRIAKVFGVSTDEAQEHIDDFYQHYPRLRRLSKTIEQMVLRDGKVKLWSGRYRHFPYRREDSFKAANSFIQGGAADIVKHVMNRINREIPELQMLLQVHDSLVFEIPNDKEEHYKARIEEIMTKPTDDLKLDWLVEFKVDGHRLGEG